MPPHDRGITLDGTTLTLEHISRAAEGVPAHALPEALERVRHNNVLADEVARRQPVYGRTTGVGANRDQQVGPADPGPGLLRSHAIGWGEPLPPSVVRAACLIRANQLLVGGSGATPELVEALAELVGAPADLLPVVPRHGSLGAGDLTALADVGLALSGERPRASGQLVCRMALTGADALPLMSSSAFTLAESGLAAAQLAELAEVGDIVCALSWAVLRGSPEAVSLSAAGATPRAGAQESMATIRALLETQEYEPAHIQDFFGLRAWPQVHGPLHDALVSLVEIIETASNTASENPLFSEGDHKGSATHHGGFHTAYLSLALDHALLALAGSAQGVMSRVTHMVSGDELGLPRFLTDGSPAASGLMAAEFVAASALSLVRQHAASPSSIQTVWLSHGVEDDAGFANLGALRLGGVVPAYRRMLAVELLTAARAAALTRTSLAGRLGDVLDECRDLTVDLGDRDIGPDVEAAEASLERLAEPDQPGLALP